MTQWHVIVCVCVFCHTNSKNFCFVYYYGSGSHRRTCRGLSVDAPPAASPSLSPFPRSFSLFQGCLEERHPPPLSERVLVWRLRRGFGGQRGMHTQSTRALHTHKEHFLSSLSKVRLDDHSQAVQTANDSQTCFHGFLLFTLTNSNEYCKNMTDAIYSNSTAIMSCQGGTPL